MMKMKQMNNSLPPFMRKMKQMNKCTKKMRKNRGGNLAIYNILNDDDDDILCEVLSRLPAKSLMRFKCVCKHWHSLIQNNPYFIDLHFTRSITRPPSLFLAYSVSHAKSVIQQYLLADYFSEDTAAVHTYLNFPGADYLVQGPINGLICLYDVHRLAVRIYNLSTRQITPWIKRGVEKNELEEEQGVEVHHEDSTYMFGFDPATKEYKVICFTKLLQIKTSAMSELISDVIVCDVLTLGHNSWRRIDDVPPFDFNVTFAYANGSIYWKMDHSNELRGSTEQPEIIVAFDVGSEKFRVITVPDFILDQPPKSDTSFGRCFDLLEVDGCVALLHRRSRYTVKLWIFDDGHEEEKITTSSNWTEETFKLPFCWSGFRNLIFHAVAGTDQIIVLSNSMNELHSVLLYDRKMKTFKKVKISGIPVRTFRCSFLIIPFVENLLPVQKQQLHHCT